MKKRTILITAGGIALALILVVWFLTTHSITIASKSGGKSTSIGATTTTTTAKAPVQRPKVCKVLDTKTVSDVMGSSSELVAGYVPDQTSSTSSFTSCVFRTKAQGNTPARSISILVRTNNDAAITQRGFDALKKPTSKTVNGLGDAAYWTDGTNQLNIRKGKSWVSVFVSKPSGSQVSSQDAATKLGKDVLGKI